MSLSAVICVLALAVLQGALVALPRAGALTHVRRLCSPAWVVALPGLILVGTFGVIVLPSTAFGLLVLAAIATPLLAVVAAVAVVRGGRRFGALSGTVALGLTAAFAGGWVGELAASLLTGLGCLALGVGLVRLIPTRWLLASVLAMCAVDVALLALGAGETATDQMAAATAQFQGPVFDRAGIGSITLDYPDLILAAALGCWVAGQSGQRPAAVILTTLAGLYGMLLFVTDILPATVPIALTFVLLRYGRVPDRWRGIGLAWAAMLRRSAARAGAQPA